MAVRTFKLATVRAGNIIFIGQVFLDGSRREIGRFMLPDDGQWRLDVDFLDDIMAAYNRRLKRAI